MSHTIESFVDTLRADGVEVGRKAAEEIRQEAEKQAERVFHEAEAKARQIVEQAERQRESIIERTQTDLELAARDTVLKLRQVLSQAVNRVLTKEVSASLNDADFLKNLIRDIVCKYADADTAGNETFDVNVSKQMQSELADWMIAMLRAPCKENKLSFELHGALSTAGFEYKHSGGTVEVTPESVVQSLSQIITPSLQELIVSSRDNQAAE